jgi:hypothetical protein
VDFFIAFCFSTARLFLIHAPTANAETTLRNGLAGSINNGTEKNIPGQCQNVIAVFLQRNLKFAHRVRRYLHRRCQRHRNHFANHNDTGAFILGGVKAGRVISVRAAVVWFGRHARSDRPTNLMRAKGVVLGRISPTGSLQQKAADGKVHRRR